MTPAILRAEGLALRLGGRPVLRGVTFEARQGEFLSVLGESGCGKTTLARVLIGLERPDSGAVLHRGEDVTALPPARRGMGIVFQNYALFQNMTALENVRYALRADRRTRAGADAAAGDLLRRMGLWECRTRRPAALSGGQQQRVAVARTLALGPDVLLLDEPMAALDAKTRLALRGELRRVQADFGATIVYITHDQEEAFVLSDRVMVMREGQIEQLGAPEELLRQPATPYVASFVRDTMLDRLRALRKFGEGTP